VTGNGPNVGPGETLHTYQLSNAPTERTGTGASLVASEYGNRTDTFTNARMDYYSASQTLTNASLAVPLGDDWEGYKVFTNITSVTENRTWIDNSGFDADQDWSWNTYDEPSIYGPDNPPFTSQWNGAGFAQFQLDGYWYDDRPTTNMYGYWYDAGDKAYAVQNLTVDRGEVASVGISLDYWADITWGSLTGFCEIFVSDGDPDNGGTYLWQKEFDAIAGSAQWYSSGYVSVDPSAISLPNISLWVGLRTSATEWWRPSDIEPEARVDNLVVYITAETTPELVNLQLNGVDVDDVLNGSVPLFGLGTAWYTPSTPWTAGIAFANFSWTPTPFPADPDLDMNIAINVDVRVYARRYNVDTVNDTELFTYGENYAVTNVSDVRWETNHYASVPGGYSTKYSFNVSLPSNRDIDFVAEPLYRAVNLTAGWNQGQPGDNAVNVSVYAFNLNEQNGFWLLKGSSPNMITNLEVWDDALGQWTRTKTFRANEDTRFRATLPTSYQNDIVTFSVYDSSSSLWIELQGTVDASGYAISTFVNLDAYNASVGIWEVQAFVEDAISGTDVHNIGFYRRAFEIDHSTDMSVQYPIGSDVSWSKNVTFGELILLELRVNDTDNGDLLPGGVLTYSWAAGAGSLSDLGTGGYSVTLDTGDLPSNGEFDVSLQWTKANYDTLVRTFTVFAIYTTELFSADAPGLDVPRGDDASYDLYFADQASQPILSGVITCNWSLGIYTVTPVGGNPGHYTLTVETSGAALDTYALEITASKDFYESRSIIMSLDVRELFTSAIPSTSHLSLPVGYSTSFTIAYTDTDHGTPITGSESSIRCNWSDIHVFGDQNYTVMETATPGVYEVTIFSKDLDILGTYTAVFNIETAGNLNHTLYVTIELRTHLTSFYLLSPIESTPYTADIAVHVVFYDVDTDSGVTSSNVQISVNSSGLPSVSFTVENGSFAGEYVILIPASQWGTIGTKDLVIYADWIGPTVKYSNETISTNALVIGTPTDLYIGESPLSTPFGENLSFTLVYFDVGNATGIVNGTGPYAGNVHMYISVVTAGETFDQSDMTITEVDFSGSPGEYRIQFNTALFSGLVSIDLRIWMNWTSGALPLYQNQTLLVSVSSTSRQTTVDWSPLPVTPYDEYVNLSMVFRDVLTAGAILNSSQLSITIQEAVSYLVFYDGDATAIFLIQVDTSSWTPGSHIFHLDVEWSGSPYYQNRTGIAIPITVRERYTSLTHGSYSPVQFGNNLTIVFTYTDVDDLSTVGMETSNLVLDASLLGFYTVTPIGDGTYTIELDTSVLGNTGMFVINATMYYVGTRNAMDASDFFYLTITQRRTQLTSELPELAPFLTLANITVTYIDDSNSNGITGADVYAFCATSSQALELGVNYFVTDYGDGDYMISISTIALGNFGPYSITVTVNWTGSPFYMERVRIVDIEVSRRPASITVSKSPLNTPFLSNVTFEITATDTLDGSGIVLDKSVIILSHGSGTIISDSEYVLSGSNGIYIIEINSTILTSILLSNHPIFFKMFWGDMVPYYSNATTSTEVTISSRFTQGSVLSTPPAFIFFNATAILRYGDYLTGIGIVGATLDFRCLNTSITSWIADLGDGTYEVIVDTSSLGDLGRYSFEANFTWFGSPFFQNLTRIQFNIVVNPVSTSLSFELPSGVTYYLGDQVVGNITFTAIGSGTGIIDALVGTDWNALYGTSYVINQLGNGVYELSIETSGLNAELYTFSVNASKYLHFNQTVTADILIAAIPVEITLVYSPPDPSWGDLILMEANVTEALTGNPVIGALVNLTFETEVFDLIPQGGGIYAVNVSTTLFASGEYTFTVTSFLLNHETRQRDFQVRINKIPSKITASLNPLIAVNGQSVTLTVDYLQFSSGTPIPTGTVTFSWIGGPGSVNWQPLDLEYSGQFVIANAPVGNHYILVQASSANFKTVSTQITIEIREILSAMSPPIGGQTVILAIYGDVTNVTVYLNNTDLNIPVTGATVEYSVSDILGNLTDLGNGLYTGAIPTALLDVGDWILTVNSVKDGYSPASLQFTVSLAKIPTTIDILTDALIERVYGENVTFRFMFRDSHNDVGIENASASYLLESFSGTLLEEGNGVYSLTINTSLVTAGFAPHDISVSFQKVKYVFAYVVSKLLVNPIPTTILGNQAPVVPIGDDYTQIFTFYDAFHDRVLNASTYSGIWEFDTHQLTQLDNGSYIFGPSVTGIDRLEVGVYIIDITLTKGNFSTSVLRVSLRIRLIETALIVNSIQTSVFAGYNFTARLTFMDLDHNVPISGALSSINQGLLTYDSDDDVIFGNGTYAFLFTAGQPGAFRLEINMSRTDYDAGLYSVTIYSSYTPEQQMIVTGFYGGAVILLLSAVLGAVYLRHWSVPKLLRWIRAMIKALNKGKIPVAPSVRDRRQMLVEAMNEDLEPVGIVKQLEDVSLSTVDVEVMDVEELLEELSIVVGLTPDDVDVLRRDLDKMRPSERAGFIGEVLKQEKARRAQELIEIERAAEPEALEIEEERKLTDDELEHLRQRLIEMGIEGTEADLMVEQAKSLTKAEIDALLDQIGGLKE
jgi:hypothetical protein